MSYLFVNNQEIKNDSGNPIPSEIIHNGSSVSTSNPLPVEFSNASINIGAEVEISNDSGNPVPISGTISVDNFPAFPTVQTVRGVIELDSTSLIALENINADVTGTVSVDNFPAFPTVQTVSLDSSSREALENITAVVTFPAVQTISGTVSLDSGSLISLENVTVNVESSVEVSNFPAVQIVSLDSSSRNALEDINATVSGTVSVDNFPDFPIVQQISGTVLLDSTSLSALENIAVTGSVDVNNTVSVTGSVTATVDNFPSVQTVSLDSSSRNALENITAVVTFPEVQQVSGTVLLDSTSLSVLENINATINGTVSVDNFPAFPSIQEISGTVLLDSTSLSALENITVTGTVDVGNTVTVSGSVTATVDNFPSVQTVSLDSSSRNALENITAVVTFPDVQNISGTVLLDSTSLSALENIAVTGTVDVGNTVTVSGSVTSTIDNFPSVQTVSLDSSSRNALENITAVVTFPDVQQISGTVLLDSTSLSALENITATVSGTVSIDNFPANQTVTISELPEVEIKNDSNNPISISRNTTQNSESNPIFVKGTSDTTFFNPTQLDAFGRLRVSEPYTLFDNSFRYGERLGNWNRKVTGTTTISHNVNQGLMDLTVGTNSGDEIIRETSRVFQYQPGKSLLIMNTFSMGTAQANVRMRVGYFGKENGIYVEREGSNLYIVKRTSVSGSVDNVRISQTIWNGDKLDGTGASGYNLGDMSKSQIFWSDIEWLGVGSVRCGFVIDGQFILAHTFHHANDIEGTYMTTATLPIRYEVTNTGTSSGATLKQICSTVISEGGYSAFSRSRTASTPLGGKAASNVAYTPMVSIRLKSNRTDAVVTPTQVSLYGLQQAAYKYALIRQPSTLTGSSWVEMDSASSVEYDISSTSITGGTVVKEGFFVGDTKGGTTDEDLIGKYDHSLQLTREIISADSTGDIFTLVILATTNNDKAVASLSWQEHT